MKFLLMITDVAGAWDALSPAEQEGVMSGHRRFGEALHAERKFVSAFRLRPADTARTVRFRPEDGRTVTDGPFSETKEVMGGYYVIDVPSMDEAIEWAKQIPLAYPSSVEVRPVWE